MSGRYEVVPYSINTLKKLLAASDDSSSVAINQKLHCVYFRDYFEALNARTIIIEFNYIDRDYLEDFSAYYVRCFHQYARNCTRLHFFQADMTNDLLAACIRGDNSSDIDPHRLQDTYLGFIVVKPLPYTVIGRTCLTTYPHDNRRYYSITRIYRANLFGIDLQVKTLAFQEQDDVVAACATSALWSAFQATGVLFQHSIPSPVEITQIAAEQVLVATRLLPNRGLTGIMMAQAIRHVGLEPLAFAPGKDVAALKSILYAYLRAEIPVLLGLEILDTTSNPPRKIGLHAVVVNGYSIERTGQPQPDHTGFLPFSSRIDRIYAHDDQIGPFARMMFDNQSFGSGISYCLKTSWFDQHNKIGNVVAVPVLLLIPVYHKIRLNFDTIDATIRAFHKFIHSNSMTFMTFDIGELEWDIYLATVNDFKAELREIQMQLKVDLSDALLASMPHFLWIAIATANDSVIAISVFDATDIEQGPMYVYGIDFTDEFSVAVCTVAMTTKVFDDPKWQPIWSLIHGLERDVASKFDAG